MRDALKLSLAGGAAGAVTGFFGACGGMVLVPILGSFLKEEAVFPASLRIMVPICLVSLAAGSRALPFLKALPFLLGSLLGGLLALPLKKKVSPGWLHKILGALTLAGGAKMLWNF